MGEVWEAWHTTLGIPVAVKLLKHSVQRSEARFALERFRMEAQITARIQHPSIVRVLDFGEEDRPYLVMELVRGPDLQAWIRRRVVVEEILALKVVGHVAVGLAALHHFGVVHRDLKPSNVLIAQGVMLKLTDLGLACDRGGQFSGDLISGTPQYLAPECLDPTGVADPRSDLYSLGVIMFRMLMGRMPFLGTTQEVLRAQRWEKPDWSLPKATEIDSGTLFIARSLLEKDPDRRVQSALELVQACREQVARLEWRKNASKSGWTETSGGRWLPLRERLAAIRKLDLVQTRKTSTPGVRRWTFWLVCGGLLLVCGFLAGRL